MGAGAWGEFGPIIAISVLLGTKSSFVAILSLVGFGRRRPDPRDPPRTAGRRSRSGHPRARSPHQLADGAALHHAAAHPAAGPGRHRSGSMSSSAPSSPASSSGASPRRRRSPSLQGKIEAIGFGFLIPLFFVVSGANLDIVSIIENPVPHAAVLRLHPGRARTRRSTSCTGVPSRTDASGRASPCYVATGLPIIVAVTSIEVRGGRHGRRATPPRWSAPAPSPSSCSRWSADRLVRGRTSAAPDQERAENTV